MSTIIIAAFIIGLVIIIVQVLVLFSDKQKQKKMNRFFHRFSEAGTEHCLSFSSQEILQEFVIGLDGVQRKMLVIKRAGYNRYSQQMINLDEVKNCTVKKIFLPIGQNDLTNSLEEEYIERIVLQFEYINNKPPVEILFYSKASNYFFEMPDLLHKAKDWEIVLSKMLYNRIRKTA